MRRIVKVLTLLFSLVVLTNSKANANDSCQVLLNNKIIFKGEVDKESSVASIKNGRFKKTDCLKIIYSSENASKGWNRTFYINGPNDENLKTIELGKQSGSVYFKASVLNEMRAERQPVFIYTISLPKDKTMAARVRVRRIFICKVEWN